MSGVCNSARARRRLNIFSRIAMPLGFVIAVISLITLNVGAASSPFQITGASITAKSDGVEASIGGFEDTKINSTATFYHINDSITYKVTLQNTTGKEYKIGTISDDNTNPYLAYSYPAHAGETVAAGENLELDVTVTYTASIPSPESRTQNLDVKFSFEYEEVPAGNSEETTEPTEPTEKETEPEEEPEDDIVVPNTDAGEETAVPDTGTSTNNKNGGASVDVLSIVGTVIGVSLMIFGIIKSRKLSERTKVLAFAALGTLTAASVANAASSSFTFGFDSSFNLKNLLSVSYTVDGVKTTTVINYGETLQIETPVKPGSNFAGWQTADGTIIPGTQEISEDTEIEATWTPITYTVSIDTDGDGTADTVDEISYGEEIVLPTNTTTNPGHNPNGWVDGDGNHYDDGATISDLTTEDGATISLTPDFTPNQFTVNIDTDGDGTDDQTLHVTYGETANLPANENSMPGHTANGWVDGDGNHYDDGADIGGETFDNGATIELTPDFTPNQYTVNIDTDGDGDVDHVLSVTYGDTANLPDNTNGNTGYLPNGWVDGDGNHYDNGFDISGLTIADGSEITLTPVIEPIQYTVNIDTDGDGNADISDTIEYDENYTLPANDTAERNGYDRNGWTDGTNHYDDNAVISNLTNENGATISITPDWSLVTYNISYSFYGVGSSTVDNSANPTTYTVEDNLTFTAPTVDGYRFLRWSIPRANVSSVTSATVSVDAGTAYTALTAFAWYEERTDVPYVVKHYIRDIDGNFTEESSVPSEGRPGQTLQINDLKKSITGYTMIGAFDTDSGTTMPTSGSVTSTTILANGTRVISIYYRPYELKIKYNLNGGSLGEGNTVYSSKDGFLTPIDDPENTEFLAGVYGGKVKIEKAWGEGINLERYGYTVSTMWYVNQSCNGLGYDQTEVDNDTDGFAYQDLSTGDKTVTLYADWYTEIYNIFYRDTNVAGSLPHQIYTIEDEFTIGSLAPEGSKVFNGWTSLDGTVSYGMTYTVSRGSTGDIYLKATWRDKQYYIHYDANEGTGDEMEDTLCTYNTQCQLVRGNFTRTDYSYEGWTINDRDYGPIGKVLNATNVDGATVIAYAKWEPYPEIEYLGNGADAGEMGVQKSPKGESVTLWAPNYSKTNHGFAGWNTKADGTGTWYGPNQTINQMPYNGMTLYAIWIEAEQGVTMQTFDKTAEPYASYSIEKQIALKDERDGNVYVVTKLSGDTWWMTENLRLNPNDVNTSITELDTNNPASGFAEAAKALPADGLWDCGNTVSCINIGIGNIDRENEASRTASNRNSSWYAYGVMYNYYAAVAGNKKNSSGDTDGDICPSGWHIPTAGTVNGGTITGTRDFGALYSAMGIGNTSDEFVSQVYRMYPYNNVYGGSYTNLLSASNSASERGRLARYWSSTQSSGSNAYAMTFRDNSGNFSADTQPVTLSSSGGYAVRCVANTPKTYKLFFEKGANDVTNMPANQEVVSIPRRHVFTISSVTPEREGYNFLGWATEFGGEVVYQPGDQLVSTSKISDRLYGRWEEAGPTVTTFVDAYSAAGKTKATRSADGGQYYTLQDMNSNICSAVSLSTQADFSDTQEIQVMDTRDEKLYWIAKTLDGKCWMTQNLDLDLSTEVTLTHENTDLGWGDDTTTSLTPSSSTIQISDYDDLNELDSDYEQMLSIDVGDWYWTDTWYTSDTYNYLDTANGGAGEKFSTTPYPGNGEHGHVGNYYNWPAAVASNYVGQFSSPDIQRSICPAGWRLANVSETDSAQDEYAQLISPYNNSNNESDALLVSKPLYFVRAGSIIDGQQLEPGVSGMYWSNSPGAYYGTSRVIQFNGVRDPNPHYSNNRYWWTTVRCVAR